MEEIGCQRSNQNGNSGCPRRNCEFSPGYIKSIVNSNSQLEPSLTDLILKPKSNKISRPPNAFMLYAREHRKLLASKYPKENNKVISSMLGECWKKVDARLKQQYFEKAKMLEELHKKQYPGYVYSPRIARMQKLERSRKKATLKCCGRSTHDEDDIQMTKQRKNISDVNVKDEWVSDDLDRKLASPEYVPNNPQYFAESDPLPNTDQNNISQLESQSHGYSSCPASPWRAIPSEPFAIPYPRNHSHEYDMHTEAYSGQQYCKPSSTCNCEVCDEYRNPSRKPLGKHGYLCSSGCNRQYASPCQSSEKYNLLNLTPSRPLSFKNPMPRAPTYSNNVRFENPPFQYAPGPYGECKTKCCPFPRPYVPWKDSTFDPPRCCYQDYISNRNQEHFKSYCNSFSYPSPLRYMPYSETFDGSCPIRYSDSKSVPYPNDSSNQEYESEEVHLNENEILNVVDDDEGDQVVSPNAENDTLKQVHLNEKITMQQMPNT